MLSGNVSSEVSIQVLVGKEAGCIYKISKPVTTIGRDAGNDALCQNNLPICATSFAASTTR